MLVGMLPDDVATESRNRKHYLYSTDTVIQHVSGELSRYRDTEISTFQDRVAEQSLHSAPKNPVRPPLEAENKMSSMMEAMQSMISVFNKNPSGAGGDRATLPRPDPKFEGCWHCGKKHPGGRRQCREFRKLVRDNKGLPKNYKGAYEQWLEDNKKSAINVLHEAQYDADLICSFMRPKHDDTAAPAQPAPEAPAPQQPAQEQHAEHAETRPYPFFALLDHEHDFANPTQWAALAGEDPDYADLVESINQFTQ